MSRVRVRQWAIREHKLPAIGPHPTTAHKRFETDYFWTAGRSVRRSLARWKETCRGGEEKGKQLLIYLTDTILEKAQ